MKDNEVEIDISQIPETEAVWYKLPQPDGALHPQQEGISIIFCIDTSGSMNEIAIDKNGKKMTRLNIVQEAISSQFEEIKKSNPKCKIG